MKQTRPYAIIIILILISLGCGLVQTDSASVVQLAPTRTPPPTFTPTIAVTLAIPTPLPIPTDTPAPPPTETPLPIEAPTDTPEPAPTDTSEAEVAAATDTPVPPPPTNTPAPAPPPPPTNTPAPAPAPAGGPVIGQFGISGKVTARDKTTFSVGEKAFFTYEATNHSGNPVPFQLLGIKASNGQFNTSWINPDAIQADSPFRNEDGLAFDAPGTYQVFLAICYAACDGGDAIWEEYPDGAATITVQ